MNAIPAALRIVAPARAGFLALATGSFLCAAESTIEISGKRYELGPVTNIVTGDIKAGIEKHINAEVVRGSGVMKLPFNGKELELKLVRVHVEYLATLGPGRHFACVDMAGADGEFYDVDFFMEGDPGSMQVTETMVHKIDGVPLYLWKQAPDKSWGRAPPDDESKELLGVIHGRDAFEFRYQAVLPALPGEAGLWIPLAQHVLLRAPPGQPVRIHPRPRPCLRARPRLRTHQLLRLSRTGSERQGGQGADHLCLPQAAGIGQLTTGLYVSGPRGGVSCRRH